MTLKAVLFDLDNTLLDFLTMKRLASAEASRAMIAAGADFGVDGDEAARLLFDHYLAHGIERDDVFATFLRKFNRRKLSYTLNQDDRIIAAGINAYLRAKLLFLEPYPNVVPTLLALAKRGLRLAVVTDAPRLKAWQRLHAARIADFFEAVVTSDDTGTQKPDAKPFEQALDLLQAKPNETLMVGDWPARDVVGASALGIRTVFARYGTAALPDALAAARSAEPRADHVIHDVAELLPLVDRLLGRATG